MDIVQLVFGFVNAPLFATFLLGMFWARATGTGAFLGLVGGTATSALFHALTLAAGDTPGIKGAYLWSLSGHVVPAGFRSRAQWRRTSGSPALPSAFVSF